MANVGGRQLTLGACGLMKFAETPGGSAPRDIQAVYVPPGGPAPQSIAYMHKIVTAGGPAPQSITK